MKLLDSASKVRLSALFTMFFLGATWGRCAWDPLPWGVYLGAASVVGLLMGLLFIRWCDELERRRD